MNRRKFLRNGTVAGLAIGTIGVSSCNSPADKKINAEDKTATAQPVDAFLLNEVTIDEYPLFYWVCESAVYKAVLW